MARPHSETVILRLRAHGLVPAAVPVRLVRLGRAGGPARGSKLMWRAEDTAGAPLGVGSVYSVEVISRARQWTVGEAAGVTLVAPAGG